MPTEYDGYWQVKYRLGFANEANRVLDLLSSTDATELPEGFILPEGIEEVNYHKHGALLERRLRNETPTKHG